MNYLLSVGQIERIKAASNNRITQALLGAYRLFSYKSRWTKDYSARTSPTGSSVSTDADDATCFCLSGGIERATQELGLNEVAYDACRYLRTFVPTFVPKNLSVVEYYNDAAKTTFKDIKTLLAKALKARTRGRIVLPEVATA